MLLNLPGGASKGPGQAGVLVHPLTGASGRTPPPGRLLMPLVDAQGGYLAHRVALRVAGELTP